MRSEDKIPPTSRRNFIRLAAAGGVVATTIPLSGSVSAMEDRGSPTLIDLQGTNRRARTALRLRIEAGTRQLEQTATSDAVDNGDEARYDDRRGSFYKTLPQNEYGEVDTSSYDLLVEALNKRSAEAIDAVPLSSSADRALANPLAGLAFEMIGPDAWALRMRPAPAFASPEMAAEMGEVYWQALTRDIPFTDYGEDATIGDAVRDLNSFSHLVGGGEITVGNLFRGETPGDRVGPYLSQFLWLPAQFGLARFDQQFELPSAGEDFGTSTDGWLAIQRGVSPRDSARLDVGRRHISTARDLAEYVHVDVSYQAYLTAALILLGFGSDTLDPENPYFEKDNQVPFVTFGPPEIVDLVAKAANAALKAAWYQKWFVHRRLRPEVFAARAAFQASGERDYGLHQEIFDCDASNRVLDAQGNLLLPLAYPEGSPTHPAYPAGHAAVAGACATMLKAFFDEDYVFEEPVQASADGSRLDPWQGETLTAGGEINKLAANISLGRDAAGVHYRSDGIDGMKLGEEVALGILADYAGTRGEPFAGYRLTRFDGTPVRVSGNGVQRDRTRGNRRNRSDRSMRPRERG